MDLFCALFGHWPTPLATRRRDGRKLNRCWLCECRLEHRALRRDAAPEEQSRLRRSAIGT